MHPSLVSYTPNFCRPSACATDRQLCADFVAKVGDQKGGAADAISWNAPLLLESGREPDLYYVRNAQLPATGQWLRKLASTVNEELRYRANRAISHGHDPNR